MFLTMGTSLQCPEKLRFHWILHVSPNFVHEVVGYMNWSILKPLGHFGLVSLNVLLIHVDNADTTCITYSVLRRRMLFWFQVIATFQVTRISRVY